MLAIVAATGFDVAAIASPQVGPFLLIPLVGIGLVAWRERVWTFVVAAIAIGIVPLLFAVFGALGALADPTAFPEFSGSVLTLASLVAPVAAVVGALRLRRGHKATSATEGWRTRGGSVVAALGLVALGAIATSAVANFHAKSALTTGGSYDVAPDESVTIVALKSAFPAEATTIHVGKLTQIAIENRDSVRHTFTYRWDGQTRDHEVLGSGTTRVLVRFDKTGDVPYECLVHPGMTGTLRVT